jgi:hypothetical protein
MFWRNPPLLENNVAYLRVGEVGKDLAEEIQSAQNALAATNKIAGTVLDLRFADGDDLDSEKAAAGFVRVKKMPLAILVNGETRDAAAKLAADLREERGGIDFWRRTGQGNSKPDIAVAVKADDEKMFLENPFGTLAQTKPIPHHPQTIFDLFC